MSWNQCRARLNDSKDKITCKESVGNKQCKVGSAEGTTSNRRDERVWTHEKIIKRVNGLPIFASNYQQVRQTLIDGWFKGRKWSGRLRVYLSSYESR